MTVVPRNPIAQMPRANLSTLPNAELPSTTAVEEDIEKLQFRGTPTPESEPDGEWQARDRGAAEKSRAAINGCMRTGEVMRALFPEGIQLGSEEEFAAFRLFDRLVGDMAHFAQSGLKNQSTLRDISMHAMLLENVISMRGK